MYTILFADDTDIVRKLFCETLRRAGYRVLEAENGAKALSVARGSGPIELLITDIMMPHLSGPQLRRALRASHFRDQRVIRLGARRRRSGFRRSFPSEAVHSRYIVGQSGRFIARERSTAHLCLPGFVLLGDTWPRLPVSSWKRTRTALGLGCGGVPKTGSRTCVLIACRDPLCLSQLA
jgi:CheY-like chemotaxis protein